MEDNELKVMETIPGDGGTGAVSEDLLKMFKNEIEAITRDAGYTVNLRRMVNEDTRYCRWEGQSADGRKHANAMNGEPAFPFEGAADNRVREADKIVNERVGMLVTAALRADVAVKGMDIIREGFAERMKILLSWVLKNQIGSAYRRELTKLANYQEGDSPGGGVLGVFWQQEWALENKTLTAERVKAILMQHFGIPPAQLDATFMDLLDPEREEEVAQLFQTFMPNLPEGTARQIVQELREKGEAEFPNPYLRQNVPRIAALRLNEDIFFPGNTTDLQRSRVIFVREWLTRVELEARKRTMGYSEAFVNAVLEHEGQTAFLEYRLEVNGVVHEEPQAMPWEKYQHRGEYEVITAYHRAINAEDVPGIYVATFSTFCEMAAGERVLLDYRHGKYPFTYFSREILNSRLVDSRGIPELMQTDQMTLKLLADSFSDHVSLTTVPPVKVPRRRASMQLVIGPLAQIKEDRPGEISWMQPPQYPIANEKQQEMQLRRINEYFARMVPTNAPELVKLMLQFYTDQFLDSLKDSLMQVLQLCQQYMEDADVARVAGDDGTQIGKETKEIQGKFDMQLSYDVSDLNLEYLVKKIEVIMKLLQIDTLNVIQRDRLIGIILRAVDPNLAGAVVIPVQAAQQKEADDEEANFAKISSGVEPAMMKEGQNFQLRLQTLLGITQKNPEALQKLTPVSKMIYDARVKFLENQVQQQRNAVIGARVGQTVLGG